MTDSAKVPRFRKYVPSDESSCLRLFDLNSPAFFAPNERADYERFLRQVPSGYEVCFLSDGARTEQVVGAFGLRREEPEELSLRWILLNPNVQGRGIGSSIMKRVVVSASDSGARALRIAASDRSSGFFARFGAEVVRVTPDGWGPGMHRVDMSLGLSRPESPLELGLDRLFDARDRIRTLEKWFEEAWPPFYGPDGPGNALADLEETARSGGLPIAFVAFLGDELVGTAALRSTSVTSFPQFSPWLAALLVRPDMRNRGVGGFLVKGIEQYARERGFSSLYAGTGPADPGLSGSLLQARAWCLIDQGPYFASEVFIYRKDL